MSRIYESLLIFSTVIVVNNGQLIATCPQQSLTYKGYNVTFPESSAGSSKIIPINLCIKRSTQKSIYRNCSDRGTWEAITGDCDIYSSTEISGVLYKITKLQYPDPKDLETLNYLYAEQEDRIQEIDIYFAALLLGNCGAYRNFSDFIMSGNFTKSIISSLDSILDFDAEFLNAAQYRMPSAVRSPFCFVQYQVGREENITIVPRNKNLLYRHVHYFGRRTVIMQFFKDQVLTEIVHNITEKVRLHKNAFCAITVITYDSYHTEMEIVAFFRNSFFVAQRFFPDYGVLLKLVTSAAIESLTIYFKPSNLKTNIYSGSPGKQWKEHVPECANGLCEYEHLLLYPDNNIAVKLPLVVNDSYVFSETTCLAKNLTGESDVLVMPETHAGAWAVPSNKICIYNNHAFRLKCLDSGYWEKEPEKLKCESKPPNEITEILFEHFHNTSSDSLDVMMNITNTSTSRLETLDLYYIATILDQVDTDDESNFVKFLDIAGNLLEVDRDILKDSQRHLNVTDKILSVLDKRLVQTENFSASVPGIFVKSFENLDKQVIGILVSKNLSTSLLYSGNYKEIIYEADLNVAFVYKNIPTSNLHVSLFENEGFFNQEKEITINSKILNLLFPNNVIPKNFELEMYFTEHETCSLKKKCVHWKYGLNENFVATQGTWNFDIEASDLGSGIFLCKYNHTTHFGLLLHDSIPDDRLLTLLTYMGIGLSIIGISVIFLTALIFKKWRDNPRNKLILNISFSILFLIILLLVSDKTPKGNTCVAVGALLHHIFLSNFFWTATVCYSNYRRFVSENHVKIQNEILKNSLFAWCSPIVFVAINLGLNYRNYDKTCDTLNSLCFPKDGYNLYFVFVPMSIILVTNFVIYVKIVRMVTRKKIGGSSKHCDQSRSLLVTSKAMVLLFFLMGLAWGLGILGVISGDRVVFSIFSYLSTFFVACQGFVIFAFYILDSNEVKQLWRKKASCIVKDRKRGNVMAKGSGDTRLVSVTRSGQEIRVESVTRFNDRDARTTETEILSR